mmetsp:Transcript_11701/g.32586  ORF Transcript_11701/g.32586 Transcript_11701/m.32586 type:complete len:109 (+) Transcript_11701:2123-2449(+)
MTVQSAVSEGRTMENMPGVVMCQVFDIFEGLEAMHRLGMVYNDITPQNIMVNISTVHSLSEVSAKLIDLGNARYLLLNVNRPDCLASLCKLRVFPSSLVQVILFFLEN